MDEKLKELIARVVLMIERLEEMEHRVATVIEGGRQQIGHLVSDLRIPEMRAELRHISSELAALNRKP